jgi:acyl dehydratase
MQDSFLNDEVMSIVGTSTPPRTGLITAKDIRKFCAAIDETNPLYLDAEVARAAGHADVLSPPLFNAAATRPAPHRSGLLGDGQYDNAAPPGLGHLQTMLAGQSWDIVRPAVAGEQVVEVFTTKSITERQGSTGTIVFVEKEATLTTPAGELIERYTSTLILRRPPPPRPPFDPKDAKALEVSDLPTTVITPDGFIKRPDMICLFMFAAAIWAVHRIHWDTPYAQSEGLPLPAAPGWMLSSYLAQLAEMRAPEGQRLQRIAVRYKAMAHPGDTLTCTAATQPGQADLSLSMVNQSGVEVASGHAGYAPR